MSDTPLWSMARDASAETFRAALSARGLPEDRGVAALIMAARWLRKEILEILLEAGADILGSDARGTTTFTAAAYAAACRGNLADALASVDLLLGRGAALDAQTEDGTSGLMHAAWHGKADLARHLIECGADLNLTDCRGKSALIQACEARYIEFCEMYDNTPPPEEDFSKVAELLILAGADVGLRDTSGKTAGDYAQNAHIVRLIERRSGAKGCDQA